MALTIENYIVYQDGRIYSKPRMGTQGGFLKPRLNRHDYQTVQIWEKGKNKRMSVHRLVALEFIPNPENKPCVNHINGIKTDNRVENLEWCTFKENAIHASKMGVLGHQLGKTGYQCKTSKEVLQISLDGFLVGVYGSQKEAERQTGIYVSQISQCVRGIFETARGYIWR